MSGHNCTGVEIVVRRKGDTLIAVAGRGRDAEKASSTSSGFIAAVRAAEKFFGPQGRFALSRRRTLQSAETATYIAVRGPRMLTAWFKDDGQDFLYWTIVVETGEVVDCGPFQFETWTKVRVIDPGKMEVGDHPVFETEYGVRMMCKHAITSISAPYSTPRSSLRDSRSSRTKKGGAA